MEGFQFTFPVKVIFRDLDYFGHVNNATYLTYLESARIAFWEHLTKQRGLKGLNFILASASIDYKSPAFFGDELEVGVRVSSVGNSSFRLYYEVREKNTGRLVATAETVQVMYDYEKGQKIAVPDELRRAMGF